MRSRKAGLPLASRAWKRELCIFRYVSRMTRTESFISQNFFIVFLETTFLHVSCYPALFIVSRKYISFFEVCTYPLIHNFGLEVFPLVMRSRKAGLSLATRARKRELYFFRYVSRMTRTESFISQNFFIVFLEITFLHGSCYLALFIVSRKYISVFRSLHLPLDTQFWTRGFPLVMRSRKAGLPLATRARKRELCP